MNKMHCPECGKEYEYLDQVTVDGINVIRHTACVDDAWGGIIYPIQETGTFIKVISKHTYVNELVKN